MQGVFIVECSFVVSGIGLLAQYESWTSMYRTTITTYTFRHALLQVTAQSWRPFPTHGWSTTTQHLLR